MVFFNLLINGMPTTHVYAHAYCTLEVAFKRVSINLVLEKNNTPLYS